MTLSPEDRRRIDLEAAEWVTKLGGADAVHYHAPFRAWLAADPAHRAAYAAVRDADDAVEMTSLGLPSLHEPTPDGGGRSRRHATAAVVSVAALALCGAGAAYLTRLEHASVVAGTRYAAGDRQREIDLPGGPGLLLDRHAVMLASLERPVHILTLLDGRARIRMPVADGEPYVVAAGDLRLTAHGAVFDVEVAHDRVIVTNIGGEVLVRHQDAGPTARPERLAEGDQIVADDSGDSRMAAPKDEPGWTPALMPLDGKTLADVIALGNRHGGKPIILGDPRLAGRAVQGQLAMADTAQLAAQLAAAFDLDLHDGGDHYILTIK